MLPLARKLIGSERLRHAAIAVALATLVGVTTILRPLDITVWSLQSKLFEHAPSEQLVFVEVERDSATSPTARENRELARALSQLTGAGAQRIFVDLPLARSGAAADEALRNELVRNSGSITLTRAIRSDFPENRRAGRSDPFFEQGIALVSNDYQTDFLGYVWGVEAKYGHGNRLRPSLWSALARKPNSDRAIYPDYSIDPADIPRLSFERLNQLADRSATPLSDKTFVLGMAEDNARTVRMPGSGYVPASLVHIMAAETALRGGGAFIGFWPMIGAFGTLLFAGVLVIRRRKQRRAFYALVSVLLVLLGLISAASGTRVLFAEVIALIAVYALCRAVVNFKRRHLYLEARSRLPNFVALQRDLSDEKLDIRTVIAVAKIARLDAIFATLNPSDQGRYLRQLASRLALGDERSTIYYDGGKYFAFAINSSEYQDLRGHLEGLRAVASQSITVSQRILDVSMTIGVDESSDKEISSRLSSAIAAADQAREAYRPVFVISDLAAESEEWDHSLQARLESALSEDRIAIKLQPQADLNDGRFVGVEALARWVDVERGEISPARFILQCERVGRLDELTKRVLTKTLEASEELRLRGHHPRMSVNVSAIQLVDSRIADLIEHRLSTQSADPGRLVIEVTETARIEDFSVARDVIEQVKRLGVSFSMDDFGVASANFEAMFELPFDEIKIDQLFVRHMHQSPRACAIVASVVRLADQAGLISVAEGIEDRETYSLLRELGCKLGQGYYIARPMLLKQLQETFILQKDGALLRKKLG